MVSRVEGEVEAAAGVLRGVELAWEACLGRLASRWELDLGRY